MLWAPTSAAILQPAVLVRCINLPRIGGRWSKVQSYISEREVKTLGAAEGSWGEKECGGLKCGWTEIQGTESVVPLVWCQRKKTENSAHTWLNLTLLSFLGVSDPLCTHMENVFQRKKSVSITFPLGQTGQIKCGFILLRPIPVQLMQADTLMLILCDDWDAAAVINVFGGFFCIHMVSIRQIGWCRYQWLTF